MKIKQKKVIATVSQDDKKAMTQLEAVADVMKEQIDSFTRSIAKLNMEKEELLRKYISKEDTMNYDCFGFNKETGEVFGVMRLEPEDIASELTERLVRDMFQRQDEKKKEKKETKKEEPIEKKPVSSEPEKKRGRGRPRKIPVEAWDNLAGLLEKKNGIDERL